MPFLRKTPLGRAVALALVAMVAFVVAPRPARAQRFSEEKGVLAVTPPELAHIGVTEHLDGQLPLATSFRDHTGKKVLLGDFYDGKRPVLLTFAYHSCPTLCSMILNATVEGLRKIGWTIGKEFDVVTISIDPHETLEKTAAKRAGLLASYGRPEADKGWHFLVGDEPSIARVASAAGFQYEYDARQAQFAHPSVVMLTKPNGQMARYLYGLEFAPNDLRIGLLEASQGKSISTVEQIILFCYHYDPQGGKYVVVATRVMQLGGVVTMIVLGGALVFFWKREGRSGGLLHKDSNDDQAPQPPPGDLT